MRSAMWGWWRQQHPWENHSGFHRIWGSPYGGFLEWGHPQMDRLWRKIPLKRMIWGVPIF
jgi:hypothetical protein